MDKRDYLEQNIERLLGSVEPEMKLPEDKTQEILTELTRENFTSYRSALWRKPIVPNWCKLAAASLLIIVLLAGVALLWNNSTQDKGPMAIQQEKTTESVSENKIQAITPKFVKKGKALHEGFFVDEAYESLKVSQESDVSLLQIEPNYNVGDMLSAAQAAKPMFMEKRVDTNIVMPHDPVKEGLTYTLAVDKTLYAIGEPISVRFELKNNSSSAQKVVRWRGPLWGVTASHNEYDFAVYYLANDTAQRLAYQGGYVCGPAYYMTLEPNEAWQATYTINELPYPAYTLDRAGTYELRSTYFGVGLRAKNIRVKLVQLKEDILAQIRDKLTVADHNTISIVALHHDNKSISLLSKLCSSEDLKTRRLAHKALYIIGTDDALHALGKAVLHEPDHIQQIEIIRMFRKSQNPVVIPYLKKLRQEPEHIVRVRASEALRKLGVKEGAADRHKISKGPEQAVESNKPIAHWAFEEGRGSKVYDWVGNNNGTIHGAKWTTGRVGRALSFDGTDDYVDCGNDPIFDITGPITLMAWLKTSSGNSVWQGIVTKGEVLWKIQKHVSGSGDFECWGLIGAPHPGPYLSTVGVNMNDGQWHHIAGTYDGAAMRIYWDGVLNNSFSVSGAINTGSDPVYIGGVYGKPEYGFPGVIDEVAIYNRALTAEEIQHVYSDGSAAEVIKLPQKATVLDTVGPWRTSGWGRGHHPYAKNFLIDTKEGNPKFIVKDAKSLHTWVRYDLLVDFNQYPIAVMRYRARNLTSKGWYSIWLDDGTGPAGKGVVAFDLGDLINDGQVHELRRDLRELKPKGTIIGMALSVYSDNVPAVFELLEFRFEKVIEPPASLVTMTPLGVMFEFRPLAGSSGWVDMELYEHGGEILTAFSCPHIGEPIQIWLAEPVDQNEPAKYYLRYRIRVTAAPLPKWGVICLSRMPKTTNKTSDKNASSTTMSAKDMNVKLPMSHGPVKNGLAAFLICEQNQFKLDEPVPLLYGVVYDGPDEKVTILAPPAAVDPGNISWLSITGPDGNDVPYMGIYVMFPLPDPKDALQLRRRRFHGYLASNIRYSFKLCTSGTYTIKWHCEMRPIDGVSCWTGELVSNEIQIEIEK